MSPCWVTLLSKLTTSLAYYFSNFRAKLNIRHVMVQAEYLNH